MTKVVSAICLLLLIALPGGDTMAQAVPDPAVPPQATSGPPVAVASSQPPPAPGGATLPDGTPVKLLTKRAVWSADTCPGDTVEFEVVDEVRLADTLVIAKGSVASGKVIGLKRKRRIG